MKQIAIRCKASLSIPLKELWPIQGDLKELAEEDFESLRLKIINQGIRFAFHVWRSHEQKWMIIDGHGRDKVLVHMVDVEGYEEPKIPCVEVEAETLAEAIKLVLDSSSTYHRMTGKGLYGFMETTGMQPLQLQDYRLKDIDLPVFIKEFYPTPAIEGDETKETVSFDAYKNAAIKQLTFLYQAEQYKIVVDALEKLIAEYGVEDYSQVLWRLLAEKNSA